MREDPVEGEAVGLVVTAESQDDDAVAALESRIEEVGGTVTNQLQFGALRVEIEQDRIDPLCDCPGIESIETEHAVGVGGDAGEDV